MRIRPVLGSISRLTILSVVDLPQPEGPTRQTISPRATSRSSSRTATVPSAYVLPTPSSRIMASSVRSMDVTLLGAVSAASASAGTQLPADEPKCYSALVNEWFCKDYYIDRQDELIAATKEHLFITICAVALGVLVAMPLALLARRSPRVEAGVLAFSTGVYTIPSLALFPLIVPFTGLSRTTVII